MKEYHSNGDQSCSDQVEGDELTGVCLLGAQTDASLLHQLVIPHCIFLASAVIFFVSGLVGSFVSFHIKPS